MEKQFTQLITLFLVFISQLSGMGSYEILNFSQDSRSLALHNSSSAYDSHILGNNPAALSLFDEKTTYSYFAIPANISSAQFQKNNAEGRKFHNLYFNIYEDLICYFR